MQLALDSRAGQIPEFMNPKTPRSQRGLVRRASKVSIQYPKFVAPPKSVAVARSSSAGRAKPPVPSHVVCSRPGSAPPGKRVSWADELQQPSPQLQRSKRLLGSLFDLRRAGRASVVDLDAQDAMLPSDAPEETLMCTTLRDLDDTSASLLQLEGTLQANQDPVHDLGGARHASTLVASRTLAVVRRKCFLVRALEDRVAAFSEAQDRRQELLEQLRAGPVSIPAALLGARNFAINQVHRDGAPVDADKSDFDSFATSFGLPAKHSLVLRLRTLADAAGDWWAREALSAAEAGADADSIRRLLAVALGINGDKGHVAVEQCNIILGDRLAREVLALAQKVQERDAATVARSSQAQPQSAKQAAKEIDDQIREARAIGAPAKHPSLEAAKCIATTLAQEEKNRYALKALKYAQEARERDRAAADAAGGLPDVGLASELADIIDREVKGAIALGAPKEHPSLGEATSVAKDLRDLDGIRKRMLARQKRLTNKG